MPLVLDPEGGESWLANELGNLLDPRNPGKPIRFDDVPEAADRYRLAPGQLFWGVPDVDLLFMADTPPGDGVDRYRFIRPAASGTLVDIPLQSVFERLDIQVSIRSAKGAGDDLDEAGDIRLVRRVLHTFKATLSLGHRELDVLLTPMGRDQFEIALEFDNDDLSPADLFKLLGYASGARNDTDSDLAWLPDILREHAAVKVTGLHALVAHRDSGKDDEVALPGMRSGGTDLQNIGVDLSFLDDLTWNLIPGHDGLEVGHLTAHLQVDHPLDADYRFPRIDVGGIITLKPDDHDPAEIEVHAAWPDYAVSAFLREGQSIPLGAILVDLGIPAGKYPMALSINRLSLEAEPVYSPHSFSLTLNIATNLTMLPDGRSSWAMSGTSR